MTEEDRLEQLAHELARRLPNDNAASGLTDAQLRAYLDGADPPDIEQQLANDAQARARLATLAGVTMPELPATLRSRVLHQATDKSPARFGWAFRLAAGLALLALGFAAFFGAPAENFSDRQRAEFAQLNFDISIAGLATVRGSSRASQSAYPDSVVTLRATPAISTSLPLRIYVFAGAPPNVTRIKPTSTDLARGAATVRFSLEQIDGLQPGPLPLSITVSLGKASADELSESRPQALSNWKIFDDEILILARPQ